MKPIRKLIMADVAMICCALLAAYIVLSTLPALKLPTDQPPLTDDPNLPGDGDTVDIPDFRPPLDDTPENLLPDAGQGLASLDLSALKLPEITLSGISSRQDGLISISATADTNSVLVNPGKGLVFMGYMDPKKYSEEFRNVVSIGYNRFGWSSIEPEEGKYDWEVIDKFINCFASQGKQFAFGVMCVNTSKDATYITPEWVFDAGARGKVITTKDGTRQMIPDWTDPIFLEKLNNFTSALAERYNGDPRISYIDIRSYGNWGEQHSYGIEGAWPDITAQQLKELYLQPYIDLFPDTQLVAPWGKDDYNETYEWAIRQGVTIRRDGIGKHSDGEEGQMVYGKLPAIFEYASSYLSSARKTGDWKYSEIEQAVENGCPTYLQVYEDMYQSNPAFYSWLANHIGYYFRLKEARNVTLMNSGDPCIISLTFRNDGYAPLYGNASVRIALLDENMNLVKSYPVDGANPNDWAPGSDVTIAAAPVLNLDEIAPDSDVRRVTTGSSGTVLSARKYVLAVGLFLNNEDEKPDYQLGSTGATADNWYTFGTVTIVER